MTFFRHGADDLSEALTGTDATSQDISLDTRISFLAEDGDSTDDAFALPDGNYLGQEKILVCTARASTGNVVVTPANYADGTTITLDAEGEHAHLVWDGTEWRGLSVTGTVA